MSQKKIQAISIFLIMAAFFLVYEYAPQYLIQLFVVLIALPIFIYVGRLYERQAWQAYMTYLQDQGHLNTKPNKVTQPTAKPVKEVTTPISGEPVRGKPVVGRVRQRPPRPNGMRQAPMNVRDL